MKDLRQRRELDKNDTSEDAEINTLSSDKAFSELCRWNGLLGSWDLTIKDWIKDIYNIHLGEE